MSAERVTSPSGGAEAGGAEAVPRRAVYATGAAVFLVMLMVYRATVIPTAIDQDSGELVAAAHTLGIAHPTGYPLWVLLGRVFDMLPLGGTSAYRVAMLSAVSSAAAAGIVAGLGVAMTGRVLLGAGAGLCFGLWYPTWSQAVRAEVYGLTGLLFALILLALRRWEADRSWRAVGWLCLAGGFVSMHHRTAFLAALPAVVAAVATARPRRARRYAGALGLLALPFICYAYVPIRALARPAMNWTNPSTLDRFLDHMLGRQYAFFALDHTVEEMFRTGYMLLPQVLAGTPRLSAVLAVLGIPFIAWGWWRWVKREPTSAGTLAAGAVLLCFWVLQWGETSDLKVFLLPLGAVLALCGALGLAQLGALVGWRGPGRLAAAAVLAVLCGGLVRANSEGADLSNTWQHRDRWMVALSQVAPDAVFVSDFDVPSFITMYLQNVEGMRQDVTLIRKTRMPDQWYVDLIEDPKVRSAAVDAWRQAEPYATQTPEQTEVFAYLLAQRLEGYRPVYVLHGSERRSIPGPPHFVGLSEDLVALEHERPDLLRPREPGPAMAQLPGGIRLVGFGWDRQEMGSGDIVGFRVDWELAGPMPGPSQFAIRLVPESVSADYFTRVLSAKGLFTQAYPVLHGLTQLEPSPPGTVYEQRGLLIVPTNAPPGGYLVAIGFGPRYATEYTGWIDVGQIEVVARPRPTNGP